MVRAVTHTECQETLLAACVPGGGAVRMRRRWRRWRHSNRHRRSKQPMVRVTITEKKTLTCCCGFGIIYRFPFLCNKEGLGEILLIIYDYMNNRFFLDIWTGFAEHLWDWSLFVMHWFVAVHFNPLFHKLRKYLTNWGGPDILALLLSPWTFWMPHLICM